MRCVYQITPYLISAWGTWKSINDSKKQLDRLLCVSLASYKLVGSCCFFHIWNATFEYKNQAKCIRSPKSSPLFSNQINEVSRRKDQEETGPWRPHCLQGLTQWPHLESIMDEHHKENQRHKGSWGARFVRGGMLAIVPVRGTFSTEAPIIAQASLSIRDSFSRNSPDHLSSHSSPSSGRFGPLHSTTH